MPSTEVDAITGWSLINPNLGSFQVSAECRSRLKTVCFVTAETLKNAFHGQQVVFCLFNEPGSLWPHLFLAMSSDSKDPWRVELGGSMQCPPAPLGFGSEALKCLPGGHQCSSVPSYGTSRTLTSWPILATYHLSIRTALIAVLEARSCR